MGIPVPGGFEELTARWLDAAFRDGGLVASTVAGVEVVPLDPGKGLLGDLARLHITYDRSTATTTGDGPATVIVKLPAADPTSRRVGIMLNAWAREVAFYRHVAPRSPGTRLPRCYHAASDPAAERWVVVLEDCHADEFDFLAGATTAQAEAAVDALADFHAIWWQSPERFDWMPGFDTTGVGGLQPLWRANLPVFVERYAHVVPELGRDCVLAFAPRLGEWSARAAGEPLTMVHSDCRLDNLLFDGDQVTMIDWQTTMRAPAAMDLSCFIGTSLAIEDRRATETPLIERYLARLANAGVPVDHAWFQRSYDENLLWWMGQFGNNLAHLDPGDDRVQTALDTMIERVYATALDRNVGRLLD